MNGADTPREPGDLFEGWDWHDPDDLDRRFERFTANVATFDALEQVAPAVPRDRAGLRAAGITGIEFAAFTTDHPQGLGTDLLSVHAKRSQDAAGGRHGDSADDGAVGSDGTDGLLVTRPGPLYRVDGRSLFTELDITEPLPFDDGCVDWVYAEHLIEHVPLPAALGWLKEVRRILSPGGLLRLTTPDLAVYIEGYGHGSFFAKHRRRLAKVGAGPLMPERRAFMLNQIFYHFGHRWIYDAEELRYVLGEAGFAVEKIAVCGFRTGSRSDIADLDTSMRSDESIYIEAFA
ncbi:MAG TPA: methyltransferase domain-containing protein [Actinocrinis sp.]|jgi:predicted SAM-dependent methyltransferase|uniref:class I SAM-dependent methyltransferase n=1 Tax=Actinocrinis sp. TaxID=1920516 RepID=UPI002DDD1BDB|nr:methyltransferase domain-containing protein [Actinocrinis sp.]HEV3173700.1 methyltransferase domain-containing protein [Actinocrinis sp.]